MSPPEKSNVAQLVGDGPVRPASPASRRDATISLRRGNYGLWNYYLNLLSTFRSGLNYELWIG